MGSVACPVKIPPKSSVTQINPPSSAATTTTGRTNRWTYTPEPTTANSPTRTAVTAVPFPPMTSPRPESTVLIQAGSPGLIPVTIEPSECGDRLTGSSIMYPKLTQRPSHSSRAARPRIGLVVATDPGPSSSGIPSPGGHTRTAMKA